jgi:hypothetical protein
MHELSSGRGRSRLASLAGPVFALMLAVVPATLHAQSTRLNGDVSNDGKVTVADAQAVLQGIVDVGLPAGFDLTFGDANCDGRVTAIDAQIILMSAADLDVSKLCVGRPVGPPVAAINVDPATGSVVAAGFGLQLNATPLDASSTALPFKTVVWTSDDVAKATVTSAGLVQGVSAGAVNILATNGSVTTIVPITVVASTTISLTVSPSAGLVDSSRTLSLFAELRDAANNVLPTRPLVWKSSNPKVAAVNAATGLVTGISSGTATITAETGTGSAGSATVNVLSTGKVTRKWTGATSSDWNTGTNWEGGVVPVATDTVQVPAGTPNSPALAGNTIVGGVKISPSASLSIGAFDLQVTGRLEADGEITGAGRVNTQGLVQDVSVGQSITYARGTVSNLVVSGRTELTDNMVITGSMEVNAGSLVRLRGRRMNVKQNLTVRGGISMTEITDTLDVRGNARFSNDVAGVDNEVLSQWTTGTFRLGGNLVLYSPAQTSTAPLGASGTNRIILNGTSQIVADTGVTAVGLQDLDISTPAVEFRGFNWNGTDSSRFVIAGRVVGTVASAISGKARVNAMHNVTLSGGTLSLRNLGVRGLLLAGGTFAPDTMTFLGPVPGTPSPQLIPAGTPYQYGAVVVAGVDKFAGTTGIANGLTIGCLTSLSNCSGSASATLGGQIVTVGGDLRQSPSAPASPLIMNDAADSLDVKGGILGPVGTNIAQAIPTSVSNLGVTWVEFTVNGDWTKGAISARGDVALRGTGVSSTGHRFTFAGSGTQTMRVMTGFSFFRVAMNNASAGGIVNNDTTISTVVQRQRTATVRENLTLGFNTKLSGNARMNVREDMQTLTGSSLSLAAVSIGSVQRVAGTWNVDTTEYASATVVQTIQKLSGYKHMLISGRASFGGNITIANNLTINSGGELTMEGRRVDVGGDLKVNSGILRMQNPADTLTVDGNASFVKGGASLPTQTLVTAGVLRVTGDISGAESGGFYPTGTHKVLWTAGNGAVASGDYNIVEVVSKTPPLLNPIAPAMNNVTVRGTLTTKQSLSPINIGRLGPVTVEGAADLTQKDTVTSGNFAVTFKSSLAIKLFKGPSKVTTVAGALTIADGGTIDGFLTYSGSYTELGLINNPDKSFANLKNLSNIVWKTVPTGAQKAGVPFNVEVELQNGTTPLAGEAIIVITTSGTSINGSTSLRLKYTNGMTIPVTLVAGSQTLTVKVFSGSASPIAATTSSIVVNP